MNVCWPVLYIGGAMALFGAAVMLIGAITSACVVIDRRRNRRERRDPAARMIRAAEAITREAAYEWIEQGDESGEVA